MKEIQLSQFGKHRGKYVALVDDEDYEYLNSFKWYASKGKNTFYAMRNVRTDGKRRVILMHWDVMGGKGVDHRDGDGLRNTRSNLRFCTVSENGRNSRKQKNTSSGYKGVSFKKATKKWRTQIAVNYKNICLGSFDSEIDAAKAYNDKAIELFGEFANLNVLD